MRWWESKPFLFEPTPKPDEWPTTLPLAEQWWTTKPRFEEVVSRPFTEGIEGTGLFGESWPPTGPGREVPPDWFGGHDPGPDPLGKKQG